jgi:superfamily II DNA/RNA helicase
MLFQALIVSSLESLVIDEADLILSYGHDEDVRQIFSGAFLPKVYQSFLMSATMTEDVEMLKGLTLRNPVSFRPSQPALCFTNPRFRQSSNWRKARTRQPILANTPFGTPGIPIFM